MRVEFDTLPAYGRGKVEAPPRFDHALELGDSLEMPVGIKSVSISPQSEVLYGVETGKGIGALNPFSGQFLHQIKLMERDIVHGFWKGADIDDIDLAKNR